MYRNVCVGLFADCSRYTDRKCRDMRGFANLEVKRVGALCLGAMQAEDLQLLVTRVMPFGKYEGRVIADLPGNYLTWFARTGFPKGEIGRLLALMHEIDHNGLGELLKPLRAQQR